MDKTQSLEEFYRHKLDRVPDSLKKEIGHFNVFPLDDFVGPDAKPLPFSRKDFYKIMLISGHSRFYYADKFIELQKGALFFANPQIPHTWEPLIENQTGFFCIFTEAFFDHFGQIKEYPVFQPGGMPAFNLSDDQATEVSKVFGRMVVENASDYVYKDDVLRNLVFELVHIALKTQPAASHPYSSSNAAIRVTAMFTELLERQFPIESPAQTVAFHSPMEFAAQLSVHVNHLNRSLKEITGKTTSQLIAERLTGEARMLLKHTDWNVSEIGACLGFEALPHFISFFRKNTNLTPGAYRKTKNV